ncbi:MAG TPA: DNA-processing protein DprA [Spirochaetota bacterium]|nr:DNA-processing protein DprA [Spirochaetota bacterium]HOM38281.1 DNA-processing protein DprA [Spirochaetota bacterium]HPQ48501.1 DNA-processing protein DprA [Spirochaetota bacterium]
MNNLYKALYLKFIKGLGPVKIKKLIEDSKIDTIDFNIKDIRIKVEKEIEKIEKNNISTITLLDDNYPESLKNIADPPVVLYYIGKIEPNIPLIAVVGTRKPSLYGIRASEYIVTSLVERGIGIVSGLAIGIDAVSHKAALSSNGYTIGVLGSSIDLIYPNSNRSLADKILEKGGAIISEFEIGTKPSYYTFPSRNRIISGLSLGTLIIEASISSGALITAKISAEQGRPVFAVPGPILKESFLGNNTLIREGGILIRNVDDIINDIPLKNNLRRNEKTIIELGDEEKIIYDIIESGTDIETIINKSGFGISKVLSIISSLIIKDLVIETGGLYSKRI